MNLQKPVVSFRLGWILDTQVDIFQYAKDQNLKSGVPVWDFIIRKMQCVLKSHLNRNWTAGVPA